MWHHCHGDRDNHRQQNNGARVSGLTNWSIIKDLSSFPFLNAAHAVYNCMGGKFITRFKQGPGFQTEVDRHFSWCTSILQTVMSKSSCIDDILVRSWGLNSMSLVKSQYPHDLMINVEDLSSIIRDTAGFWLISIMPLLNVFHKIYKLKKKIFILSDRYSVSWRLSHFKT